MFHLPHANRWCEILKKKNKTNQCQLYHETEIKLKLHTCMNMYMYLPSPVWNKYNLNGGPRLHMVKEKMI